MTYDELLQEADRLKVTVKEKPLSDHDGLWYKNRIAIRKDIPTLREKVCVLAEELGHFHTTSGNILNQNITANFKQEKKARMWGYNKLIGLTGIIDAYEHRCKGRTEISEFLGVTEEFLEECVSTYRSKYGIYVVLDNYIIYFEPNLAVLKLF